MTNDGAFSATNVSSDFVTASFRYSGGDFPGTGGSCSDSLGPGESCELYLTFEPARSGEFFEVLRVVYDNGAEIVSTERPTLTGTGLPEN